MPDTIACLGVDGRPANTRERAGIGNLCYEILRVLPRLAPALKIRIYLDREPVAGFPLSASQAEFRVITASRAWTQTALARELRRDPPSVLYSASTQLPFFAPCPCVATLLDLACYRFGKYFTWKRRMGARFSTWAAVKRSTRLVAISQATKDDVLHRFHIDPGRITVTHLGVPDDYQPCRDRVRAHEVRLRLGLQEPYVLYVGTLQPRKNLVRLIDAFTQLTQCHPELPHKLVLAGHPGWLYEPIQRAAYESPARERILFLGYADREDMPILMAEADLLALVSLWEGFGIPLAEAMRCGTAVIASNCSSMPEVVGDAGVLVDPLSTSAIRDGMQNILFDGEYRGRLERLGLARSERFTWESCASRILDTLRASLSCPC